MTQNSTTPGQMMEMFTYSISCNKGISEVASKMVGACEQFKFALLHTYNYHEILEGKGFPIERKVFIYEICQAKMASKILRTNPEFSIFMPCKIVIYEHEGSLVVSTMKMEMMLKIFEENKEMYNETMQLFGTLKELMTSLTM